MTVVQRRFFAELRDIREDGNTAIEGHAAVFDGFAELGPDIIERLAPTAFDRVLRSNPDVRALKNHDPNMVLGRTGRNLQLEVDDVGLRFRIDPLPNTTAAADLREEMDQGLITGASFAFIPDEERLDQLEDGRFLRTHTSVGGLFDVSPVTFPAYSETDVSLRAMDLAIVGPVVNNRARLIRARHRSRRRER